MTSAPTSDLRSRPAAVILPPMLGLIFGVFVATMIFFAFRGHSVSLGISAGGVFLIGLFYIAMAMAMAIRHYGAIEYPSGRFQVALGCLLLPPLLTLVWRITSS